MIHETLERLSAIIDNDANFAEARIALRGLEADLRAFCTANDEEKAYAEIANRRGFQAEYPPIVSIGEDGASVLGWFQIDGEECPHCDACNVPDFDECALCGKSPNDEPTEDDNDDALAGAGEE